jgi:hypothetical protein
MEATAANSPTGLNLSNLMIMNTSLQKKFAASLAMNFEMLHDQQPAVGN